MGRYIGKKWLGYFKKVVETARTEPRCMRSGGSKLRWGLQASILLFHQLFVQSCTSLECRRWILVGNLAKRIFLKKRLIGPCEVCFKKWWFCLQAKLLCLLQNFQYFRLFFIAGMYRFAWEGWPRLRSIDFFVHGLSKKVVVEHKSYHLKSAESVDSCW